MRLSHLVHPWPRPQAREDQRAVGISFVDVLFALVIGEVLDPLRNYGKIPGAGISHLAVAGILVVTSWVGYHNSRNRPIYFIRFPNLPLFQFLIDISLVLVYWLAAISAEGTNSSLAVPRSAVPETILVAISFGLYVAWDWVGARIRRDPAYTRRPSKYPDVGRRVVTVVCFAIAVIGWVAVGIVDPRSIRVIVGIDLGLIVLLLAFRFLKEYVTPERNEPESPPACRQPTVRTGAP